MRNRAMLGARVLTGLLLVVLMGGSKCTKGEQIRVIGNGSVESVIAATMNAAMTPGTLQSGAVPTGADAMLLPAVNLDGMIANGSSGMVTITSAKDFDRVFVGVDGRSGSYTVVLPAPTMSAQIVLTLTAQVYKSFDGLFSISDGTTTGAAATLTIVPVAVIDADIRLSLSWDGPADLDVSMTRFQFRRNFAGFRFGSNAANDQFGQNCEHLLPDTTCFAVDVETTFFANTPSPSGGKLDVDSNVGCVLDGINAENLFWGKDAAPTVEFVVTDGPTGDPPLPYSLWRPAVLLTALCGQGTVNYTVDLIVDGVPYPTEMGTLDSFDRGIPFDVFDKFTYP